MDLAEFKTAEPPAATARRQRRRSFFPRFGLRTMLVVAVLFCLLFAWLGRNLHRMRQEDAAIEALLQAKGMVLMKEGDGLLRHPAIPVPRATLRAGMHAAPRQAWYARLLGWADRGAIQHVGLDSYEVDDAKLRAALDALAVFPEIESVSLRDEGFDDASLPPLKKLPHLQAIMLDGAHVTGEGLAILGPPLQIRSFYLTVRPAAELLPGLTSLAELRSVKFHSVPMRRADLEAIVALPHLEELHLMHCRAYGPDAFQPLANAKGLRVLEIRDNGWVPHDQSFRDDDMPAIANLPSLEALTLRGIGDTGLAQLSPLTTLRRIDLDAPVTDAAARGFSASHPECLVRYGDGWDPVWYLAGVPVDAERSKSPGRQDADHENKQR